MRYYLVVVWPFGMTSYIPGKRFAELFYLRFNGRQSAAFSANLEAQRATAVLFVS